MEVVERSTGHDCLEYQLSNGKVTFFSAKNIMNAVDQH